MDEIPHLLISLFDLGREVELSSYIYTSSPGEKEEIYRYFLEKLLYRYFVNTFFKNSELSYS
jgi:hypothetical protein